MYDWPSSNLHCSDSYAFASHGRYEPSADGPRQCGITWRAFAHLDLYSLLDLLHAEHRGVPRLDLPAKLHDAIVPERRCEIDADAEDGIPVHKQPAVRISGQRASACCCCTQGRRRRVGRPRA